MQLFLDEKDLVNAVGRVQADAVLGIDANHLGGMGVDQRAAILITIINALNGMVPESMAVSHLDLQLEIAGKLGGTGFSGAATLRLIPSGKAES